MQVPDQTASHHERYIGNDFWSSNSTVGIKHLMAIFIVIIYFPSLSMKANLGLDLHLMTFIHALTAGTKLKEYENDGSLRKEPRTIKSNLIIITEIFQVY